MKKRSHLSKRKRFKREFLYNRHRQLARSLETNQTAQCPEDAYFSRTKCFKENRTSDVAQASQSFDGGPLEKIECAYPADPGLMVSSPADSLAKPSIPLSPLIDTVKKHLRKIKYEEWKKSNTKQIRNKGQSQL